MTGRAAAPALAVLLLGAGAFVLASLGAFLLAVKPPRLTVPVRPADYGLSPERVRIGAPDGTGLAGWFVPRPGAAAVLLLHGYPAEKADLLPLAAALSSRFAVLLMDLRYFGESEGRVTTLGLRERADVAGALDFLAGRGHTALGVFGLSLGGAIALTAAAEDARIRAVAAYAPFSDLRALGHELYGWLWALKYPFVGLMMLWGRIVLGGDITRPSPAMAVARLSIPVLLVHSRGDEQISFAHAERLQAGLAGNPRAELLFTDRGRHGELPSGFERRLGEFFSRALETRP